MNRPPGGRAQITAVPPDVSTAQRVLSQADQHLASASIVGVDANSRYGLMYDAARKAADAVLRASGRRVTQGFGHHIVYIDEAKRLLGPSHASLWDRLQVARSIRNGMEYSAREVTQMELDDLHDVAAKLVAAARAHVDGSAGPAAP